MNKFALLQSIFGDYDPSPSINIKNEDLISCKLHTKLCHLFLEGKVNGIWFHVANEGVYNKSNYKPIYGTKLKKMGKAKGMADYVFLWDKGCALIEVKYAKNKLTEEQKLVKEWAEHSKIPHFVAYSAEEAVEFLKKINFIKD